MCFLVVVVVIALSISIVIVGLFNIIWGLKQTITVFVLKSFWKCLFDGLCSSGRRSFVLITHLRIYRPYYDFDEILSFYFFIYIFCFVIRLFKQVYSPMCIRKHKNIFIWLSFHEVPMNEIPIENCNDRKTITHDFRVYYTN